MKCTLIIFVLFFSTHVFSAGVEFEVTGKTETEIFNKAKARNKALYNAFVAAFKKTMIPLVVNETLLESNKEVLTRNIYSPFNRYIAAYSVLQQKAEDKSFEITLRVTVRKDEIAQELKRLGLTLRASDKPRFIVVHEFEKKEEFLNELVSKFEQGGFPIINKTPKLPRDPQDPENGMKELIAIARNEGADFIVHIFPKDETYVVRLISRGGELILQSFIYSASLKKEKLKENIYADTIETALSYWSKNTFMDEENTIISLLYFKTYSEIESFKTLLSKIKGVENVQEKSVIKVGKDKKMSFSCKTKLPLNKLIKEIQDSSVPLQLISFEKNNVSFRIKKD